MPRTKRPREPRPEERPLDDGVRYGPEAWLEIEGVVFCHWDRWLLRLAITERDGLGAIATEFRARTKTRGHRGGMDAAEAMLAQIADLESRLAQVRLVPAAVLDHDERASEWLQKKAFKRVWHDGPNRRTEAMLRTPRRVLAARALRGHWSRFPVSPARYEAELGGVVSEGGYYDHRWTGLLADMLEAKVDSLAALARSDDERRAIHRAAMTVIVDAMDRVDDSAADMGEAFARSERAYLALVPDALAIDGVLRDLLELAVWENYGLITGVEDFLRELSEPHADAALQELDAIIAELRVESLESQLAKAIGLRRVRAAE